MEGDNSFDNRDNWGIIPRSFNDIFNLIKSYGNSSNQSYELYCSIQEIYLKEVRDLLDLSNTARQTDARFFMYEPKKIKVENESELMDIL